MAWSTLKFGIHEDFNLPQVLFKDPDWFFYIYKSGGFNKNPIIKKEAEEIYNKATKILIPREESEQLEVEYFFLKSAGKTKFFYFLIVPKDKPIHAGESLAVRNKYLNMELIHLYAAYDKSGYKDFIRQLKEELFSNPSKRMTKQECEKFFEDDSYFDA